MLDQKLQIASEFILGNYNEFLSSQSYWHRLPDDMRNGITIHENEIEEKFFRYYKDYEHDMPEIIPSYENIIYRSYLNPKLNGMANFLLEKKIHPLVFEIQINTDYKNTPIVRKYPDLNDLIDSEGLISSRNLNMESSSSFTFGDLSLTFSEHLPYDVSIALSNLIDNDYEVLFRPDFLNFSLDSNFKVKVRKARVFGSPIDVELFRKRIHERKRKWLFQRYESKDNFLYIGDVYRFEVLRTERERIFFLSESLPYSENNIPNSNIMTYILHSESDTSINKFCHIDASLLIYKSHTYMERIKNHIDQKVKAEKHIKLFRINKSLEIDKWTDILKTLYPHNELVYEFIYGDSFRDQLM